MTTKVIGYLEKSLNELEELSQEIKDKEKFKTDGSKRLTEFFTNLF
jgi:hypothetical protein